jgi:hypothetical protein
LPLYARLLPNPISPTVSEPNQEQSLTNPEIESFMTEHLIRLMQNNDAPPEQFERLGL